jgi:hypothetical protein
MGGDEELRREIQKNKEDMNYGKRKDKGEKDCKEGKGNSKARKGQGFRETSRCIQDAEGQQAESPEEGQQENNNSQE